MDEKVKFKELYIKEIIEGEGAMSDELNALFDYILVNEFHDSSEAMSEFIQSIIDENTVQEPSELDLLRQENEELKQRQEMSEEAILTLSDMLLTR